MSVRKTLIGTATGIAAIALVPIVQAAPPGDAHERESAVTRIADAHERNGSPASGGLASVVDAHQRSLAPLRRSSPIVTDAHDRGAPSVGRPTVVLGPGGFDWRDAAIGALSGIGLALLVGGLLLITVGRRTGTRLATR